MNQKNQILMISQLLMKMQKKDSDAVYTNVELPYGETYKQTTMHCQI